MYTNLGSDSLDCSAQTCHGSNGKTTTTNQSGCALVTVERPDIFVPQGLAPRDWFFPQTRGTWYCHEMQGSVCLDQTRLQCDSSFPLQADHPSVVDGSARGCCKVGTPGCGGEITPKGNNIQLHGATDPSHYWCRLGRFRTVCIHIYAYAVLR